MCIICQVYYMSCDRKYTFASKSRCALNYIPALCSHVNFFFLKERFLILAFIIMHSVIPFNTTL